MIKEQFMNEIREKIKKTIEKSDQSQNKIAQAVGIDPGNLSRFLHGKDCISDKKLTKLMQYLKIY